MTQVNPTMTNLLTTVSCPNCSFAIVYDTVARALQKYNINLIPCLQCIGKLVISDTRWFFPSVLVVREEPSCIRYY